MHACICTPRVSESDNLRVKQLRRQLNNARVRAPGGTTTFVAVYAQESAAEKLFSAQLGGSGFAAECLFARGRNFVARRAFSARSVAISLYWHFAARAIVFARRHCANVARQSKLSRAFAMVTKF